MTHSVPGVHIWHVHALSARQPQRGPAMQRDQAGSRITPSADSAHMKEGFP